MFGLGTSREDEDLLRYPERFVDYWGSFSHERGAGEYDSVAYGAAGGVSWSKSQSKKRSSAEFQDASMNLFESTSSYFKLEEQADGVEGDMESSRVAAEQSASAVTHIGNRTKLLDEFAFVEARLKDWTHKKGWEKQIERIQRAFVTPMRMNPENG